MDDILGGVMELSFQERQGVSLLASFAGLSQRLKQAKLHLKAAMVASQMAHISNS
jgi:hypothetical protein